MSHSELKKQESSRCSSVLIITTQEVNGEAKMSLERAGASLWSGVTLGNIWVFEAQLELVQDCQEKVET